MRRALAFFLIAGLIAGAVIGSYYGIEWLFSEEEQ